MNELLKMIDDFNRKERYFVFTQATGNRDFKLGGKFRKELSEAAGTEIPESARAYIDYHLDWLHAAVHIATNPGGGPVWPNSVPGTVGSQVSTGNQEDIDLVVAFEDQGTTWLILVEAKADTGWGNRQLESKAERLRRIFGESDMAVGSAIRPVFCLWSPRRPIGLITRNWPEWMLQGSGDPRSRDFRWFPLTVPPGRKKVIGCDALGKPSKNRPFWKVTEASVSSPLE